MKSHKKSLIKSGVSLTINPMVASDEMEWTLKTELIRYSSVQSENLEELDGKEPIFAKKK